MAEGGIAPLSEKLQRTTIATRRRRSDGAAAAANNNQTAAGHGSARATALEAAGKRDSVSVGSSGTAMEMAMVQLQRWQRQ